MTLMGHAIEIYVVGYIVIWLTAFGIYRQDPDIAEVGNTQYRRAFWIGVLIVMLFWPIVLPIMIIKRFKG